MARGKIERETVQNRIKEVQEAVGSEYAVSENNNMIQVVDKKSFNVTSFPISHWSTFLEAFKMSVPVEEKKEGKKATAKK